MYIESTCIMQTVWQVSHSLGTMADVLIIGADLCIVCSARSL